MKIGDIELGNTPVCLAPMAGTSSVTYRGICVEQGAAYGPTELVSARSLAYGSLERSFRYMQISPTKEKVTAIQLFGYDPSDFEEAVKIICNDVRLKDVDIIDINMGCPVAKVVKTGAGSALMNEPEVAFRIVESTVREAEAYGKTVTVKTRIGFSEFNSASVEFARGLASSGAAMVCVHGRTAKQMYGGEADWNAIKKMRDAVVSEGAKFFSNGDVKDEESARRILEVTEADGIMVGRAAMGDPWIFARIRAALDGKEIPAVPSVREKCDMLMRELKGTVSCIGEETGVKEMRSVMPHYLKGLRGASSVKVELCRAATVAEVEVILKGFCDRWI